jgi:hypothetical protein
LRDLFEAWCVDVCVNESEIELQERLRELGRRPIDADTQKLHLRRMNAGADSEPRWRGLVWVGIASAAVVGFLAGSTGLAMADALPNRAQRVAHDVLGAVEVDVPAGQEGKRGPCVAEAAKIKDKDAKKAAMDACPKGSGDDGGNGPAGSPNNSDAPGHSGDAPGHSGGAPGRSGSAPGQVKHTGDPCHGRPPWAGPMSKEQRDAAKQAASRAACPTDSNVDSTDSDDADEASEQSAPIDQEATTTTVVQEPTTTVAAARTTTTSPEPSGEASSTSGESFEG